MCVLHYHFCKKRMERESLLSEHAKSIFKRMHRKRLTVFASVKGPVGQVWVEVINTVGALIRSILPKCIWKTFSPGMSLIGINIVPFPWQWPVLWDPGLSGEMRGLLEASGIMLSHSEEIHRSQLFSLLLNIKEAWSPTVSILQLWKKSVSGWSTCTREKSRKKKIWSLIMLIWASKSTNSWTRPHMSLISERIHFPFI